MNIDWNPEARPQKAKARAYVFDGLKVEGRALFLPGNGCMCVKSALASGAISLNTEIVAVERSATTAQKIRDELAAMGFVKFEVFEGELDEYPLDRPIDYAFIDLLGPLTYRIAKWLSKAIHIGMEFSVAVSYAWRNSDLLHDCALTMASNRGLEYDLRDRLDIVDECIVYNVAVLRSVMREFDFLLQKPLMYQDSRVKMLVFRVRDLVPQQSIDWPSLEEITSHKRIKMNANRTQAALKALDTRRAARNAAERRSQAAHKAWATRRAMAAKAAKRSAAAHKAWATRRAMAQA